jgi:glucose/arabinose dehydrogenase
LRKSLGRLVEYLGDPKLPLFLWLRLVVGERLLQLHRLWDLTAAPEGRVLEEKIGTTLTLAYSPDGRSLATAEPGSGGVRLLDARTGQAVRTFTLPSDKKVPDKDQHPIVVRAAFAPDGRTLAIGDSASRVTLWNLADGLVLRTLVGWPSLPKIPQQGRVGSLAFSPDGTLLAVGFGAPGYHGLNYAQVVKVWEVRSGKEVCTLAHQNSIPALAFSPDGRYLATASHDRTLKLWQAGSWELIRTLSGPTMFKRLALSSKGEVLAAGDFDGAIRLWDTGTGHALKPFAGHSSLVTELTFSPDGRTLATASWDQTARLWDVRSRRELRCLRGHTGGVSNVAFSPDGNTLASTGSDGTVRLWEAASSQAVAAALAEHRDRQGVALIREAKYLRRWLIHQPIDLAPGWAALSLDEEHLQNEARLQPRPGDAVRIAGEKREWRENQDTDPRLGHLLRGGFTPAYRLAYTVCYLHVKESRNDLRLTLAGPNEQAKVYLNGKEVLRNQPSPDAQVRKPTATVTLARGTNVLVIKVINQRRMWHRCLQLTDKDGNAVKDLEVRLTP